MKMLHVKNVEAFYGDLQVLRDVSFSVQEGKISTVLGSNGAGKTTTLKVISGILHPRKGEVIFQGTSIKKSNPYDIARLGIAHVPEGRELFYHMTVFENLEMGAYYRTDGKEVKMDIQKIMQVFPVLHERQKQLALTLSGGEQQMLAIARGLMSRPTLMLLDEPSLGLSPFYVQKFFGIIKSMNQDGMTILLVEQNARMALQMAHYAFILETGRITLSGEAKALSEEEHVRRLYLGG